MMLILFRRTCKQYVIRIISVVIRKIMKMYQQCDCIDNGYDSHGKHKNLLWLIDNINYDKQ